MTRVVRSAVYAVVAALVLGVVGAAVWNPQAEAVVTAQDRLDSASTQQGRLSAMVASADRFAQRGPDGPEALGTTLTAVPEEPELAAFVLFMDQAARSTGCVIRQLNPRPAAAIVKAPGGLTGIGVDMAVVGSMDQVQAFLVLVSRLDRAMTIDELQINQESDRLVELAMVVRIFRSGPPEVSAEDVAAVDAAAANAPPSG